MDDCRSENVFVFFSSEATENGKESVVVVGGDRGEERVPEDLSRHHLN
jgi:hypothetical protein